MKCEYCGAMIPPNVGNCPSCGATVTQQAAPSPAAPVAGFAGFQGQAQGANGAQQKSKMIVILLAIFLGGFGIHNFYLGYNGKGIAQLVLTLCTAGIGWIWAFIDVLLVVTGSIKTDAAGIPLKD